MKQRIQIIQPAKAPIKLNVHTFNTRVVPIGSYISQLLPCPKKFEATERVFLHTILRLPQNALCHSDFYQLQCLGGLKIRSITVAAASALFRTASKTLTSWPEWIRQLEVASAEHLPCAVSPSLSPSFWDSPPIACNLREACLGFPSDPRWCEGTSNAIQKIHTASLHRDVSKI